MFPLVYPSGAAVNLATELSTIAVIDTQADVLSRSLAIAVLVVAPYAAYKIRQVRRIRASHQAVIDAERAEQVKAERGDAGPPRPALEDVIHDIPFVVDEAGRAGGAMLVVPHDVTVSDRDAPAAVVDTLIRDALRRSGLVVTAELETDEGKVLECALASRSQHGPAPFTGTGVTEESGATDGNEHD